MTRPVVSPRLIALIMAGGSFLLNPAIAAQAEEAAAPVAPAEQPIGAARINIAPLRIELDAANPAATVMLTNTSERPVPVQARLFAWHQQGGEDTYQPSTALTISPAIVSIPPGATQIVRLLRNGPATPGEKPFRLTVDQLPDPAMAVSGQAEARLRFTLPVFFDRDTATPAALAWSVTPAGVQVTNSGGATARLMPLEATTASGAPVKLERNSLRYVQPGSTLVWPVAGACALGPVTIAVPVDGRTVHAQAAPICG